MATYAWSDREQKNSSHYGNEDFSSFTLRMSGEEKPMENGFQGYFEYNRKHKQECQNVSIMVKIYVQTVHSSSPLFVFGAQPKTV